MVSTVYIYPWKQESLANAKVSARGATTVRTWRRLAKKSTANQRKAHNAQKYIQCNQWVITLSLTIRLYLDLFSCCVPNVRNPTKFSKTSNVHSSRSSKLIDLGVNRKRICNFLLVIIVTLDVSPIQFPRHWRVYLQNSSFSHPTLVWRRLAEERFPISI